MATHETKSLQLVSFVVTASCILVLIAFKLSGIGNLVLTQSVSLTFHSVIEIFTIFIAFAIFAINFVTSRYHQDNQTLFLSVAFLVIGAFDFFHAFSFPGMPDFITANSTNKTLQFWMAARFVTVLALFFAPLISNTSKSRFLGQKWLLAIALLVILVVSLSVFRFEDKLPVWFAEGRGLTRLKIDMEWLIVMISVLAMFLYAYVYYKTRDRKPLIVLNALIVICFSEIAFTLYYTPYDLFLTLGHVYKFLAYYFIGLALFFTSIAEPFKTVHTVFDHTVKALGQALDLRDKETEGHSQRVVIYTIEIAKASGIKREELEHIAWGALLHDIGKIGVPDSILFKPASLNEEEWKLVKKHPELGYNLVSNFDFMKEAGKIVLYHHEYYNGTGYPKGLKGEEIPIGARIFAIADAFDALTTDRPYRKAAGLTEAIAELEKCVDTQFDPEIIRAAIPALKGVFEIAGRQHIFNIAFE